MSSSRAVVWLDHQDAQFVALQEAGHASTHLKAHHHNTRQHASGVRTEHEFFGAVCSAINGGVEALVVGSHTVLADLKHYIAKHSPVTEKQIAGWQPSEHLSDPQLAALGRKFFDAHDRMAGRAPGVVQ
jgi:hypothetical protein